MTPAVAATGAYCWSMASNYNYLLKPPVVAVRDAVATEIVRRQTLSDVFALDAVLADRPAPPVAPSSGRSSTGYMRRPERCRSSSRPGRGHLPIRWPTFL